MTRPLLQVIGLTKSFGGVLATDNVTLDIDSGKTHAIIGPNGAGKTTFLSQLSGMLTPDLGRVRYNGTDITSQPVHRRVHSGVARSFQITNLIRDLSVLDNVALAVQAHAGHSFKFWIPARVEKKIRHPALSILERVGLEGRAADATSALSHGERRQLEIAMALAAQPKLLLLDEPMAGMGPEESAVMVETLKSLKSEMTILLVEHDMDAVFALADVISVLVYGRLIATGLPEEIRSNEAVRQAYLGEE